MSNFISVMFVGAGSLYAPVNLPIGQSRPASLQEMRVVLVQQIFSSISGGTVAIVDATDSFSSEFTGATSITQNDNADYTDRLYLAVIAVG